MENCTLTTKYISVKCTQFTKLSVTDQMKSRQCLIISLIMVRAAMYFNIISASRGYIVTSGASKIQTRLKHDLLDSVGLVFSKANHLLNRRKCVLFYIYFKQEYQSSHASETSRFLPCIDRTKNSENLVPCLFMFFLFLFYYISIHRPLCQLC